MSVTSPDPVSSAKAIELIETALFANGYPLIQIKPDTIQILGIGKMVRAQDVPTITKPEDIPVGERVINYVYKLKFRECKEVVQVLSRHLLPTAIGTPIISMDEPVRAVIITERSSSLRSVIKLLGELDQPKPK